MYSKQEAAQLRQEFWTAFGQYMSPVLSAEGEKVNWVNYKTGEKDIRFRMSADNKTAEIAIELTHKDAGIQQLYFDQFVELKSFWTLLPVKTGNGSYIPQTNGGGPSPASAPGAMVFPFLKKKTGHSSSRFLNCEWWPLMNFGLMSSIVLKAFADCCGSFLLN
jgi:hypothetical protein